MLDREVWDVVARTGGSLAAGMTTVEIDAQLTRALAAIGAHSAFPAAGFPANHAVSVNEEIANGIPSDRRIGEGDLVTIDTFARRDGAFATAAWTFTIGGVDDPLVTASHNALRAAIAMLHVGGRIGDVSSAIQRAIEDAGFQVVHELVGYAIVDGEPFKDPQIPCYGSPGTGARLRVGQRFAVHVIATSSTRRPTIERGWPLIGEPGSRGVMVTATIEVAEHRASVIGGFPGFWPGA